MGKEAHKVWKGTPDKEAMDKVADKAVDGILEATCECECHAESQP